MNPRPVCAVIAVSTLALLALGAGKPPARARAAVYHSPSAMALAPDGKTLWVADQTANSVAMVDAAQGKVVARVSLRDPRGLVLSLDGRTLYVTSGEEDRLYRIDTGRRRVVGSADTGRQPVGLALSPDGQTLYCCCQFTDDVWVYDAASLARKARLPAVREPRYASVTADGKTLVVANLLPLGSNLDDTLGAGVSLIGLADGKKDVVQLSRGATDVGQVCISSDGRYAYVVHVLARWLVPPTQLERGWVSTNALTIVDLQERKRLNTVLLDDLDRGAANPWGTAISPDGKTLYTTHAGTNEVQIIDVAKLHKLVAEWPADSPTALEDDLTAVYRAGVRQRVPSGGVGPRAVVATNSAAYVGNYFSGTVVRLDGATGKVTQTIALGPQPTMDPVRHGEQLFADATVCFQGWQSCASCHPDGRTDALAWDLLNDGMGNPKSAKSMLLAGRTPPSMAHGIRASMDEAVAAGYQFILFHVPTAVELTDTAAYLSAMRPARSPARNRDGSLSAAAKRGQAIFARQDVGCAPCHPAPLYTDLKMYDVGTRQSFDSSGEFDTPTLVEMYRTAPYLHDGSAVTLRQVLTAHNQGDKHGQTSQLSPRELDDLAEFLRSL